MHTLVTLENINKNHHQRYEAIIRFQLRNSIE